MVILEDRMPSDWDLGDKLTFALAGLAGLAADRVKQSLNPVRGFTDDYPTRLLADIDFWVDQIREVEKEVAKKEPEN